MLAHSAGAIAGAHRPRPERQNFSGTPLETADPVPIFFARWHFSLAQPPTTAISLLNQR
jgi:hypothetical protein